MVRPTLHDGGLRVGPLRLTWLAGRPRGVVGPVFTAPPRLPGRYIDPDGIAPRPDAVEVITADAVLADLAPLADSPGFAWAVSGAAPTQLALAIDADAGVRLFVRGPVVEAFRGAQKLAELHLQVPGLTWSEAWLPADESRVTVDLGVAPEHRGRVVVTTDDPLVDPRSSDLVRDLRTWGDAPGVHHLDEVPDDPDDELVFVFSALSDPGVFTFNYRRPLAGSRSPRVFVLDDFREQGVYFLAENRSLRVFDAVQEFIRGRVAEAGVSPYRVRFVGTSKGGTGALIHGLTFGSGTIVIGAPQWNIGTFLATPHPGMVRAIAGGRTDADVAWLNAQTDRIVAESTFRGTVTVLVGERDHHWEGHVQPMVRALRARDVVTHVLLGRGTQHGDIGPAFSQWLAAADAHRTGGPPPVWVSVSDRALRACMVPLKGWQFAARLVRDGTTLDRPGYRNDPVWDWTDLAPGTYVLRIFVRERGAAEASTVFNTTPVVVT